MKIRRFVQVISLNKAKKKEEELQCVLFLKFYNCLKHCSCDGSIEQTNNLSQWFVQIVYL